MTARASSPDDHAFRFSMCPITFVLATEKSRHVKRPKVQQPFFPHPQASGLSSPLPQDDLPPASSIPFVLSSPVFPSAHFSPANILHKLMLPMMPASLAPTT